MRSRGSAATAEVGFGGEEKILLQLEVVGVYIVRYCVKTQDIRSSEEIAKYLVS